MKLEEVKIGRVYKTCHSQSFSVFDLNIINRKTILEEDLWEQEIQIDKKHYFIILDKFSNLKGTLLKNFNVLKILLLGSDEMFFLLSHGNFSIENLDQQF